MLEEAAQELLRRKDHDALFTAVRVVLPTKADLGVGDREQAMVGDSHAMGIAGQVMKHVFGAAEGRLGIDHPVLPKQEAQRGGKGLFVVERQALAEEA